jgi:hypothetical protein
METSDLDPSRHSLRILYRIEDCGNGIAVRGRHRTYGVGPSGQELELQNFQAVMVGREHRAFCCRFSLRSDCSHWSVEEKALGYN